jgi:ribonuclease R
VVAIADVSHYVRLEKPLDQEAQERGTSVYFPHFVLPMLPEALSNGLCSLNPHVDRLCMVCDLKLSRTGRVTGYEFYPAVMHSKARLTYNQVNQYLEGDSQAIPESREIHKSINTLFQLYQILKDLRADRHAMEFETVETYMTFDELGGIKEILPRSRNDAHKLIEECMLLANVAAAEYALEHDIPMLYRVHEAPEFSRIKKFVTL